MPWLPLALVLLFGVFALVLPLVRLVRAEGRWGVSRSPDPVHRAMVAALLTAFGAALAWAVALPWAGPELLGVWATGPVAPLVGVALALGSLGLVMLAQAQMGASWRIGIATEPTALVTHGVFRWIRHPIYTGLLGLLVALVLVSPSPWTVMATGWLASLIAVEARLEERHLEGSHGARFSDWAATTGRFLPGV